jgi:fructokinase
MITSFGEINYDVHYDYKSGKLFSDFGGGPFNVANALNRLKSGVRFFGCVGSDSAGEDFMNWYKSMNMDYVFVDQIADRNTPIVLAVSSPEGTRYSVYCKKTADKYINIDKIINSLSDSSILHIGSVILTEKDSRNLIDKVIDIAKQQNIIVTFDVNYSESAFVSETEAIDILSKYAMKCDIIKFSRSEALLFTKTADINSAMQIIKNEYPIAVITLDVDGAALGFHGKLYKFGTEIVPTVDPIGAGDAFWAGFLSYIDKCGINNISVDNLGKAIIVGNKCGQITVQTVGEWNAFPSLMDLRETLNNIMGMKYEN